MDFRILAGGLESFVKRYRVSPPDVQDLAALRDHCLGHAVHVIAAELGIVLVRNRQPPAGVEPWWRLSLADLGIFRRKKMSACMVNPPI